jgi:hypothetical protein
MTTDEFRKLRSAGAGHGFFDDPVQDARRHADFVASASSQLCQRQSGQAGGPLVRHTDTDRECAYGRRTEFGRLDEALDAAPNAGWTVIAVKADWKQIFKN